MVRAPGCRRAIRAVDAVRRVSGVPVAVFGDGFAVDQLFSLVAKDHYYGYRCSSDKDHYDPYPLLPVHVRPNLSPSAASRFVLRKAVALPA